MRGDPIIRGPKEYREEGTRYRITAYGGLHYIRGNSAPYFSLAGQIDRHDGYWRDDTGGCIHEAILTHWPDLAPLAALHLADQDGVPLHAEGNGWYALAGALGGMGERYHTGNSERHFPLPPERRDPAKPWVTTEYRCPTEAEAMAIFAEHCRISLPEAEAIAAEVRAELGPPQEGGPVPWRRSDYTRARARWATIMESMRPRWAREAQAAIKQFGLKVYGDKWEDKP